MARITCTLLTLCTLSAACGGPAPSIEAAADDVRSARFVDAVDYLSARGGDQLARWVQLRQRLRDDFAQLCGDTFCEGDHPDLQPLELRCSVGQGDGQLRSCVWAFAGSSGRVAASGLLKVDSKVYLCRLPASGAIEGLIDQLLAPGPVPPLQRPVPGATGSLDDALGECGLGH